MSTTKPDTEIPTRHPLAIAWDEWLASEEGKEASNVDTLARYTDRYLENRLKRAFDAGAKAATPSPSDFEQLIRLRKAASNAADLLDVVSSHLENSYAKEVAAALREALVHTGGES